MAESGSSSAVDMRTAGEAAARHVANVSQPCAKAPGKLPSLLTVERAADVSVKQLTLPTTWASGERRLGHERVRPARPLSHSPCKPCKPLRTRSCASSRTPSRASRTLSRSTGRTPSRKSPAASQARASSCKRRTGKHLALPGSFREADGGSRNHTPKQSRSGQKSRRRACSTSPYSEAVVKARRKKRQNGRRKRESASGAASPEVKRELESGGLLRLLASWLKWSSQICRTGLGSTRPACTSGTPPSGFSRQMSEPSYVPESQSLPNIDDLEREKDISDLRLSHWRHRAFANRFIQFSFELDQVRISHREL